MEATLQKQNSLLKKYLKENYGINVSIRRDSGSLNIDYNLGCSKDLLKELEEKLCYYDVDCMQDISIPKSGHKNLIVDGIEIKSSPYCFITREINESFRFRVAQTLSKFYKHVDLHDCNTEEDYKRNFDNRLGDCWNWGDLARKELYKMNFISQDENEIKLINAFSDEDEHGRNDLHIIYSIDNQIYRTNDLPVKKETTATTIEFSNTDFKIVDYSPKSIAVYGEKTKLFKNVLNEFGRYNPHLKGGPGWIFPKSQREQVMRILNIKQP